MIVDIGTCMCSDSERLVSGSVWHCYNTPRSAIAASVISAGAYEGVWQASEGASHLQPRRCCSSYHWLPGIQLPAVCILSVAVVASSIHCLVITSVCDQCSIVSLHCTVSEVVNKLCARPYVVRGCAFCQLFVVYMWMYVALCAVS